jgi:hypothetical protein
MYRKGIGLLAAGSGHNADRCAAPITAARRSDSVAALRRQRPKYPQRVERALPEFLAERLFEPLGMADTGFAVPAGKLGRFISYYRTDPAGGLELVDAPAGQWSSLPAFPCRSTGVLRAALLADTSRVRG